MSGRLQLAMSCHDANTGVQGAIVVLDGTSVLTFWYVDLEIEY